MKSILLLLVVEWINKNHEQANLVGLGSILKAVSEWQVPAMIIAVDSLRLKHAP